MEEEREESPFKEYEDKLTKGIESLVNSVGDDTYMCQACTGEPVITFAVSCLSEESIKNACDAFIRSVVFHKRSLMAIKAEGAGAVNYSELDKQKTTLYWRSKPTIEYQKYASATLHLSEVEEDAGVIMGHGTQIMWAESPETWIIRARFLISKLDRELNEGDLGYFPAMRGIREDKSKFEDSEKYTGFALGRSVSKLAEAVERSLIESGDMDKIKLFPGLEEEAQELTELSLAKAVSDIKSFADDRGIPFTIGNGPAGTKDV